MAITSTDASPPAEQTRGRLATAVLLIITTIALLSATYVGLYMVLSERIDWRGNTGDGPVGYVERCYSHRWQVIMFLPAARLEGSWIGCPVELVYSENPGPALIK